MAKADAIRENPLNAAKVADEEFKIEEYNKAKRLTEKRKLTNRLISIVTCGGDKEVELMETVVLEKTIIKLGSLLALGFGEAGADIIHSNMKSIESASIDAMVVGRRVDCVMGVARIADFSTFTEVLQGKAMAFVNQVAEIVHGITDEHFGAANKTTGDSFFLVWRRVPESRLFNTPAKLADMSIASMCRIIASVHRSAVLASYRFHPGIQQRLGKNCRVNVTTGLHYGWAIEGAVGTEFKIDPSYLSPNVSVTEAIEHATKSYHVPVLISQAVIATCSPSMSSVCRLIDKVQIPGSSVPLKLYAIDLDFQALTSEPPLVLYFAWSSRQRFKVRQYLEAEKEYKLRPEVPMASIFQQNTDIVSMRFRYTQEFLLVFNMGYQNYSQGEWQVAQRLLNRTKTMLGVEDGPSAALLRFMELSNFEAPKLWAGVRDSI